MANRFRRPEKKPKVIGRNLDSAGNRQLVEDFLATVPAMDKPGTRGQVSGSTGGAPGGAGASVGTTPAGR